MDGEQLVAQKAAEERAALDAEDARVAARNAELESAWMREVQDSMDKRERDRIRQQQAERKEQQALMGAHSRKRMTTAEFVERRLNDVRSSVNDSSVEVPDVNVTPSIFHALNGRTWLAESLGANDGKQSMFVNDFILHAMDVENVQDTKDGYGEVLNRLMERIDVRPTQKPEYIISRLYAYLTGRNRYADDDIVISIMRNKTRHRYAM